MGKLNGINSAPITNDEVASYSYAQSTVLGFQSIKTGNILMFGGSVVPSGYLLCDGSAVSRTTYPNLFSSIGTTYGAGNGSTTFNLPNLKGKMPIGVKSGGNVASLGASGGAFNHTHSIQNHVHSQSHLHTANHTHSISHAHSIDHQHGMDSHTHDMSHTHGVPAHHHNFSTNYAEEATAHTHTYTINNASSSGNSQMRGGAGDGSTTYFWTHETIYTSVYTVGGAGTGNAGDTGFTSGGASYTNTAGPAVNAAGAYTGSTNGTSANSGQATLTSATDSTNTGNLAAPANVGTSNPPFMTVNFIIKV